jgi:acyl-CoA thioesterase-1
MQNFLYLPLRLAVVFGLLACLAACPGKTPTDAPPGVQNHVSEAVEPVAGDAGGEPGSAAANQGTTDTLLVLGDSISAAYGMSLQEGWVALLARKLEGSHPGLAVVNASISGETTSGALRRLPQLLARHEPVLVVLELGGNDGLRGFDLKDLGSGLTRLAQLARESGAAVIILPMEIPENYGEDYRRQFRQRYAQAASATGSTLAPFPLEGIATVDGMMQGDGIHPTVAAQPILLNNVWPTLLEVLDSL